MNLNYRYEIKFIGDVAGLANFMQWIYCSTSANKVYKDYLSGNQSNSFFIWQWCCGRQTNFKIWRKLFL